MVFLTSIPEGENTKNYLISNGMGKKLQHQCLYRDGGRGFSDVI